MSSVIHRCSCQLIASHHSAAALPPAAPAAAAAALMCTARHSRWQQTLQFANSDRSSKITMLATIIITIKLLLVRLGLSVAETQYTGK